jgi:hypothetical protein
MEINGLYVRLKPNIGANPQVIVVTRACYGDSPIAGMAARSIDLPLAAAPNPLDFFGASSGLIQGQNDGCFGF